MLSGSVVIWDIDSVSEVCDITDILHSCESQNILEINPFTVSVPVVGLEYCA